VRERVESGEIAFTYCRSADNASDLFTKALPRHLFEAGLKSLGVISGDQDQGPGESQQCASAGESKTK